MTDTSSDETDTTGQAVQVEHIDTAEQPGEVQENASLKKARGEAAGYRERLRAAEGERDGLSARLTSMATQMANGQIEAANMKPEALWASGVTVQDFMNDDGLDTEALGNAILEARDKFGIPNRRFNGSADQGSHVGRTAPEAKQATWGDLLKPKAEDDK